MLLLSGGILSFLSVESSILYANTKTPLIIIIIHHISLTIITSSVVSTTVAPGVLASQAPVQLAVPALRRPVHAGDSALPEDPELCYPASHYPRVV